MTNMPSNLDDLINFPIPRRYFNVVIQALAQAIEAEAGPVATGSATNSASSADPAVRSATSEAGHADAAPIDWTKVVTCRQLRRELRAPGALVMLDLAAGRPNQFVAFQEVVAASGRDSKQARADLGALTKAIKRSFGVSREDAQWPVEVQWAAGGEAQAYYRMTDAVANAWNASGPA